MKELKNRLFAGITKNVDLSKRDLAVDCLRVTALICIFLIHASPDRRVDALLQFCVPAMVFISGVCYHGATLSAKGYFSYVKKRFFRIALPASIFALVFGLAVDLFCLLTKRSIQFSAADILTGVILYKGIGYVWIMRVFFFISLLLPLAHKLNAVVSDSLYLGCCLIIYMLYRALYLLVPAGTLLYEVLYYFLFETIPYFLIWLTGMRYVKMQRAGKFGVLALCFVVLTLSLIFNNGDVLVIRSTKYPASDAYMAYGVIVTILLYETFRIVTREHNNKKTWTAVVCAVSSKSNELYLAHIPFVYFIFMVEMSRPLPYLVKFVFIICAATVGLTCFLFVVGKLKKKRLQDR